MFWIILWLPLGYLLLSDLIFKYLEISQIFSYYWYKSLIFENILCIILITLNTIECFVIYQLAYPKECAICIRLERTLWWNLLEFLLEKFSLTDFFNFSFWQFTSNSTAFFFFLWEYNCFWSHCYSLYTESCSLLLISLCFWVSAVWLSGSKLWIDVSRYTILCTLICDFGHKNKLETPVG